MQPLFYSISLNNPLLSDVTIEANKIFTDNGRLHPPSKQQSILANQQTLVEQQPQRNNNRLSFLTRSSLSDDEPVTPKSANKHVFYLDHHIHYGKKPEIQPHQQQYRFYNTDLNIPAKVDKLQTPSQQHHQDILFDNSKMNLRRRHNRHSDGKANQLGTSTISAGTGVLDNTRRNGDDLVPDDFEIVRANITGITRAMQAFHVRELFWDEATANIKATKKKHKRHHTAPDQHVAHNAWTTTILDHGDTSTHISNNSNFTFQPWTLQTEQDLAKQKLVDDEKETSIQPLWHPTDSLSDAPTSFYDDLSQQQRSWVKKDDDDDMEQIETNDENDDAWRQNFMGLMASLVKQSEHLEYLSTELLSAESHVRSLLSLASTVQDQFYEREKQYQDRLRECDVAGQQQLFMIASLEELMADLDMKSPQTASTPPPPPPPPATATIPPDQLNQLSSSHPPSRQLQQLPAFLLPKWYHHMWQGLGNTLTSVENDTFVYRTRWHAGMLLGADVGTGDIIHVFQHPTDGIEMVIAGFGIIMEGITLDQESTGCTVSSSQKDKMVLHQYQLHLLPKDRKTTFVLLPENRWIPDLFVDQCQHEAQMDRCSTRFTLFQRKHHCRRCGKIVCQRHSGNRLPLFKADHVDQGKTGKWYRICDTCFILAISSVSSH